MKLFLVLTLYNLLLPLVFVLGFPAWLIKMLKRGGYGSGLLQRFGIYKEELDFEPVGSVYVHAVSVGEVMIALKLIKQWRTLHPKRHFLLAPTTATGHAVAKQHASSYVRVIYSPLDFIFITRRVLQRFEPSQIVLIEAEAWPNLLYQAKLSGIPTSIVNARLSPRSRHRFLKFRSIVSPIFTLLNRVCVQDSQDIQAWKQLGLKETNIHHTGSIKFDPAGAGKPERSAEFEEMLQHFGPDRKIVMAISTHEGEEIWIAEVLREHFPQVLYVPVPRHFERAKEVALELSELGYEVVRRSQFQQPTDLTNACFLIDSTGELKTWIAHSDIAIIGKSILGKGGQNPSEAIAAGVPVICGPHMKNFQTLVESLQKNNGIKTVHSQQDLKEALQQLLSQNHQQQTQSALRVLDIHTGATLRTIEVLESDQRH